MSVQCIGWVAQFVTRPSVIFSSECVFGSFMYRYVAIRHVTSELSDMMDREGTTFVLKGMAKVMDYLNVSVIPSQTFHNTITGMFKDVNVFGSGWSVEDLDIAILQHIVGHAISVRAIVDLLEECVQGIP